MTRAEYAQKYGQAAPPAHITMTHAEYNQKYGQQAPSSPANTTTPEQPKKNYSLGESLLSAVKNIIPDVFNVVGGTASGIGQAVMHPIDTGTNIVKLAQGTGTNIGTLANQAMGKKDNLSIEDKQNAALATGVGKAIYDSYGSWDNIKRSFAEHPAQVLLDLSNVLDAGGSSISKIGEVGDLSKIADAGKMVSKAGEAINPISGAFKVGGAIANKTALGEKISGAAKFGVSQATGLSPETITEIAKNPSAFSKEEIANASRESLASTVKTNIDKRLADLSETGKEYNPIKTLNSAVSVPKTAISEVLNKFGITLGEDGKIIHTAESTPMSQGDINQIQGWIDKYGNENIKNPNSFLNARQATGKIANFASGTTTAAKKIGTALYAKLNEIGRPQIQGLAELDSKYSPETQMLKKIKADWLDKSGNLKDTAMTRIANLTKAGREQALSRLENISPGITQKVNSLRAIEDIKNASGLKVGTYYRGAAGAAGLATLNIPMIAASILSIPEVAVPVIKAFGMGKEQVSQLLGELSKYSSGASLPEGTAANVSNAAYYTGKLDNQANKNKQ